MDLPKYFEAIENHLDKYFEVDNEIIVFHEKESPDFHLDIYWIKPNRNRKYIILMTNGVSSFPLKTPKNEFFPFIELCILLPENWNFENDKWKLLENYWPIKLLKNIGRYFFENNTWLGYGHAIPLNELLAGTNFVATIVLNSGILPKKFQKIEYGENIIKLYTVFPLFHEEYEYTKKNGANKLLDLFMKKNINEIIDIKRMNVCRNIE